MHVVSGKDFNKVWEVPRNLRDKTILQLLFSLGLRTGEICTIKIKNVDLKGRRIKILDSKKHQYFTLPIDNKTAKILEEYIGATISERLFPSKWNKLGHISARLVEIIVKRYAPYEWHPTTFRRRFASNWIRKNGNLVDLQRILRHKRFSSTSTYVDGIMFEDEIEEMNKEYCRIMANLRIERARKIRFKVGYKKTNHRKMEIEGRSITLTIVSSFQRYSLSKQPFL